MGYNVGPGHGTGTRDTRGVGVTVMEGRRVVVVKGGSRTGTWTTWGRRWTPPRVNPAVTGGRLCEGDGHDEPDLTTRYGHPGIRPSTSTVAPDPTQGGVVRRPRPSGPEMDLEHPQRTDRRIVRPEMVFPRESVHPGTSPTCLTSDLTRLGGPSGPPVGMVERGGTRFPLPFRDPPGKRGTVSPSSHVDPTPPGLG